MGARKESLRCDLDDASVSLLRFIEAGEVCGEIEIKNLSALLQRTEVSNKENLLEAIRGIVICHPLAFG